ncbi:MAG: lipocalin family protein [Chromatiales bacterium]|nr:lipocalin family protein [Chromatiales bacterium]
MSRQLLLLLPVLMLAGCTSTGPSSPLQAVDREVDLERFMGDWYVIAHIPIHVPLLPMFSERDAWNGVESYRLTEDGVIETTYTFRRGGFDGPERRLTPRARVYDTRTNAEWRMQFIWPFQAAFLIAWLDDDYQRTVIGVPDRSNVWIMARSPEIPEAEYQELVDFLAETGHDLERLRRVPQRWPAVD